MDAIQRAVVGPQVEIVEQRAARRQILRDRSPLASRTQNTHDAVHQFPHIDVPPVAAAFGRRNQSFDVRPLVAVRSLGYRRWCGHNACGSSASTSATLLE